jgi:glutathione S-transferase
MAIDVVGMNGQVQVTGADTNDPTDSLRQQNPLGKIPTLILENGEALYDSRVIVDYLNETEGRGTLIPNGSQRFVVLRQQALADGVLDAAILQVYERRYRPPEHHVESWLAHQQGKVDRALAHAEQSFATPREGVPHIGEIALAAALGYLDFRFEGAWRAGYPKLVGWLGDFARRTPAFANTAP